MYELVEQFLRRAAEWCSKGRQRKWLSPVRHKLQQKASFPANCLPRTNAAQMSCRPVKDGVNENFMPLAFLCTKNCWNSWAFGQMHFDTGEVAAKKTNKKSLMGMKLAQLQL